MEAVLLRGGGHSVPGTAACGSRTTLPPTSRSPWPRESSTLAGRLTRTCAASSFLTFGIAVGFAGPLLDVIREDEGVVFNLHGKSTSGKSLSGRGATSIYGRARKSDLVTYDITPRALEELCASRNDLIAVLDEQGRIEGTPVARSEKIRSIAFMMPSGVGQQRSEKATQDASLRNVSWRLFALTSGEKPLEDRGGRQRVEGEQVRHVDIKVPSGKRGGIFERLDGSSSQRKRKAIKLAKQVEATIGEHYGVALRPYLERLVANRAEIQPRVREIVETFIARVGAASDGWEYRFASKFGLVLAGAVLASEWKVAPWDSRSTPAAASGGFIA